MGIREYFKERKAAKEKKFLLKTKGKVIDIFEKHMKNLQVVGPKEYSIMDEFKLHPELLKEDVIIADKHKDDVKSKILKGEELLKDLGLKLYSGAVPLEYKYTLAILQESDEHKYNRITDNMLNMINTILKKSKKENRSSRYAKATVVAAIMIAIALVASGIKHKNTNDAKLISEYNKAGLNNPKGFVFLADRFGLDTNKKSTTEFFKTIDSICKKHRLSLDEFLGFVHRNARAFVMGNTGLIMTDSSGKFKDAIKDLNSAMQTSKDVKTAVFDLDHQS